MARYKPLQPRLPFTEQTDELDAPLTPAEARARLIELDDLLARDPEDGPTLADWLITNYWAHQKEN